MAKCPICKTDLPLFNWTKTKGGKNWLQNKDGVWHDCPSNSKKNVVESIVSDGDKCYICGTDLDGANKNIRERTNGIEKFMIRYDGKKEKLCNTCHDQHVSGMKIYMENNPDFKPPTAL